MGWTLRKPTPLRLTRFARKSRCPSRLREGNGGKPPIQALRPFSARMAALGFGQALEGAALHVDFALL